MTNSTHRADVIRIGKIEKHPNADSLGIVKIFDGFTCCVRLGDFKEGDLAVYIQPDSICPNTEQFAFLGEHKRIKVKKLRGIPSMGLLIKAPFTCQVGDDVSDILGITHYNPPEPNLNTGAVSTPAPHGFFPHYDVESFRKYGKVFEEGEIVYVSEKCHGSSGLFLYKDNKFHLRTRTRWVLDDKENIWSKAFNKCESLKKFLQDHPSILVYGEIIGNQDLKYGHNKGEVSFVAFDIMREGLWVNSTEMRHMLEKWNVPLVPLVCEGPFNFEKILQLGEGPSLVPGANHVREGVVVKPKIERWNDLIGRVSLKIIGNGYLERV